MTVTFVSRAAVLGAARPPIPSRLQPRTTDEARRLHRGFTGHHVGDGGALYRPNPIARLRGIYDYHVLGKGYGDIAYEGAFDAGGVTYGLRDHKWVGAHALSNPTNDANRYTDGIVFLEDSRGWTPGATAAWAWWRDVYRLTMGRWPILFTHASWARVGGTTTACPGSPFLGVLKSEGATV